MKSGLIQNFHFTQLAAASVWAHACAQRPHFGLTARRLKNFNPQEVAYRNGFHLGGHRNALRIQR
jgi:hypothetical protein